MEKLYKIKEALMHALEESKTAKTGDLQAGEIDAIHKLTDTIKNIEKICMLKEENGYSEDGGQGGGSYGRGYSYANRGQHYVRGHYSRDGGNYASRGGRYSRDGGYSRNDARDHMIDQLHDMINNADNEEVRSAIHRCINQLENA